VAKVRGGVKKYVSQGRKPEVVRLEGSSQSAGTSRETGKGRATRTGVALPAHIISQLAQAYPFNSSSHRESSLKALKLH